MVCKKPHMFYGRNASEFGDKYTPSSTSSSGQCNFKPTWIQTKLKASASAGEERACHRGACHEWVGREH